MTNEEVLQTFSDSGALLTGHFLLSSGLHSSRYLQCALVLQQPATAEKLCSALAAQIKSDDHIGQIDLVIAPALGGVIVSHEIARALGVRALFTERQDSTMTLRHGFQLNPGEHCLVVEDVVTTGGSTRECIAALEKLGGKVLAAASIIDRSGGTAKVGVPRIALATLEVPSYKPEDCPMCAIGEIAVKPGSKAI